MSDELFRFDLTPENRKRVEAYAADHGLTFEEALNFLANEAVKKYGSEVIERMINKKLDTIIAVQKGFKEGHR